MVVSDPLATFFLSSINLVDTPADVSNRYCCTASVAWYGLFNAVQYLLRAFFAT